MTNKERRARAKAGVKRQAWRAARRAELHARSPFCAYCGVYTTLHTPPELLRGRRTGRYFRQTQATLDHFVPQARGGKDTKKNTLLACWPCNQRKGTERWLTLDQLLS